MSPATSARWGRRRERARAAQQSSAWIKRGAAQVAERSEFCGYEADECQGRVVALLRDGAGVEALAVGERGEVIWIARCSTPSRVGRSATPVNCWAPQPRALRGRGHAEARSGRIRISGDWSPAACRSATACWRASTPWVGRRSGSIIRRRTCCTRAAQVLGTHVTQKGLAGGARSAALRLTRIPGRSRAQNARRSRSWVNDEIRGNAEASIRMMELRTRDCRRRDGTVRREVREPGAGAVDGLSFSTELCGGTHVKRTGDIGIFHNRQRNRLWRPGCGASRAAHGSGRARLRQPGRPLLADIAQLCARLGRRHGRQRCASTGGIRALEKANRVLRISWRWARDGSSASAGRYRRRDGARDAGGTALTRARCDPRSIS